MIYPVFHWSPVRVAFAAILLSISLDISDSLAIVTSEFDDFQNHTAEGWGIAGSSVPAIVVDDAGPLGIGDTALLMDSTTLGGGRLLVLNQSQWLGNWTAAGISQVKLDV